MRRKKDNIVLSADERPSVTAGNSRYRRPALIGFAVAVLMCIAYMAGGRIDEWRSSAPQTTATTTATTSAFTPLSGAMVQSGSWAFAGKQWDIRSSLVAAADVESRLNALANASVTDASTNPDVPSEILHAIEMNHVQPVERNGNLLYTYQKQNLKAQLLARKVEGTLKVVSFGITFPHNASKWQLLEGRPNGKVSSAGVSVDHLLPLPENSNRIAGRLADDGQMLLEVVTLSSNSDELTILWRDAGWEVRPSGLGNPAAFSLLCGRGNDVVYAWSADPREALRSIILVRSPTDAELQDANLEPAK